MMAAAALAATILLSPIAPHPGDSVTFQEIYPKEAKQGGRTPQFPWQPNTQLQCWSTVDGTEVLNTFTAIEKDQNLGDGMWGGTTAPLTLAFTDPARCAATLFTLTEHKGVVSSTVWATLWFDVGA